MTIRAAVDLARERLERAGIPSDEAALDARLLAQFLLGWDSVRFVTAIGESWPSDSGDFAARYEALVIRRALREPLAYITGQREFWGLEFEVSPDVLIPRPETELIIEAALELRPDRGARLMAADVGTGSGCLAVALAREYPRAHVVATDLSVASLRVAERNAARHGVADRITFVNADLFAGARDGLDLIVSNPPYVPERDRGTLPPEVRDHEPAIALFAGEDGMTTIARLVAEAPPRLVPGGLLLFELGLDQSDAVAGLISKTSGFTMVGLTRDLQGIPRIAIARRD